MALVSLAAIAVGVSHSLLRSENSTPRLPQRNKHAAQDIQLSAKDLSAKRATGAQQTTSLSSYPPRTSDLRNSRVVQKSQILEELRAAAITYNREALPLIEPHLYSTDPEVRQAAVEAIILLGAKEGAPLLRKASASWDDRNEAAQLLEKADYLELPSGNLLFRE